MQRRVSVEQMMNDLGSLTASRKTRGTSARAMPVRGTLFCRQLCMYRAVALSVIWYAGGLCDAICQPAMWCKAENVGEGSGLAGIEQAEWGWVRSR